MGKYKNEGAGGRLKRGRGKRRKLHHKRGKMSANSTKISAAYMNGGGKTWSQRHGGRGRGEGGQIAQYIYNHAYIRHNVAILDG